MRKIGKLVRELENKPRRVLVEISLVIFLVTFLIGFSSGLFFRELRLGLLQARQRAQKIEEERRLNALFERFPQVKSFQQK